jgi:hypothetical protein
LVKFQNRTFTFLTDYIYAHIDHIEMSENRVRVAIGNQWGATDIDGNLIIPCEYDWIDYARKGRIKAGKNGKEYVLDLNGVVLEII